MRSCSMIRGLATVLIGTLVACSSATGNVAEVEPATSATASQRPVASAVPGGDPSTVKVAHSPRPLPTEEGAPCGALQCRLFDTPEQALAVVLRESRPRVLGVGEVHVKRDKGPRETTTQRFGDRLLPLLEGRAAHLVAETLVAPPGCADADAVASILDVELADQRDDNPTKMASLVGAANMLGIDGSLLEPTCDNFREVRAGGGDILPWMGVLIAELLHDEIDRLLRTPAVGADAGTMVVAYGGISHNDLVPRKDFDATTYGPRIDVQTQGRFVELDLFAPEQIDERFNRFAWASHFKPAAHPNKVTLFRVSERSYALVFAREKG